MKDDREDARCDDQAHIQTVMYISISRLLGRTHVSPRAIHVGFVVKQSGTGTGFLRELWSLLVSYHSTNSILNSIIYYRRYMVIVIDSVAK
jgi:hypothetical protein